MDGGSTRPPVTDWATDFDHYAPEYVQDPFPINDELRAQCPVARTDRYGGVVVPLSFEDVADVAHRTDDFTSRRIIISEATTDRRGVNVPGDVTAAMLGVDPTEGDQFREWIHQMMEVGPTNPVIERMATEAILDYMAGLIADRRRNGSPVGGDLVTHLFDQQVDEEPIADDDLAKMLLLLMLAGIDTTWSAMGHAFLHLATVDDDRRRLVEEPELIPTATEEFLRAFSPVNVGRIATRDTELGGCPVTEGDWVMLNYGAANRDPEMFDQADQVVIDRQRNRHAAFGLGVHRCLGSNLARLEMNVATEMLLARFPDFSLVEGHTPSYSPGAVRGPRDVPVTLG